MFSDSLATEMDKFVTRSKRHLSKDNEPKASGSGIQPVKKKKFVNKSTKHSSEALHSDTDSKDIEPENTDEPPQLSKEHSIQPNQDSILSVESTKPVKPLTKQLSKPRNFMSKWSIGRPWLQNGPKGMWCSICRQHETKIARFVKLRTMIDCTYLRINRILSPTMN